jgi:GNAT superfamily N-acetyltransferase
MTKEDRIRIVRARPEAAACLTQIAWAAKAHWGYPAHWMARWREALTLTPNFIAAHPVFMARVQQEPVGLYALGECIDPATLAHFWVNPTAMGQGVGRALFAHAAEYAGARGARVLEIESDPHAEGFYRRLGARRVGGRAYELDGKPRILPLLMLPLEPPR